MEHLDARDGSLTENPANVGAENLAQKSAELDRALAQAIRQLIAEFQDAATPTA